MQPAVSDNALARFALIRPITVLVVLATVLVLGVVAWVNTPIELIPSGFSPPFMRVHVPYQNATAQEVEEKITKPIEQALATTPGLEELSSRSNADSANLTMVFDGDADMNVAYRDVRERVARVRRELPADVQRVEIDKESGASIPVAFYGIHWDESVQTPHDLVTRHLLRKIERIEGVGVVQLWGQRDRQVRIEVDRTLAEAANVNIYQLAQKLGQGSFNLASGAVREAGGKYLVRSLATHRTLEDIAASVVGPNGLRLGDIADVVYEAPELERYDRWNGRPSMVMFVIKESQANTVEVCDAIKVAVEQALHNPILAHFGVEPIFLQGDTIRYSLDQVVSSGLQGGLLAVLVLLVFLRRLRLTLLIALSIPLSLFMSIPVMYFSRQSINLVSLLGLMICVGMVVDNSIVVAENIDRYRARGVGRWAAALHGTSEVALPIALSTLTTMIVFAPTTLLSSGPIQFFMIRMVTPICVSLLASLLVAMALVPLVSAALLDDGALVALATRRKWFARLLAIDRVWKAMLTSVYEATLGRMSRWYEHALRKSLHRRMDVVAVLLLLLASLAIPMRSVEFTTSRNFGSRQFNVYYSMPGDTSLAEADMFFRDVEALLESNREQYRVSGYYVGFDDTFAQVQVFFEQPKPGEQPFKDTAREVFELLPQRVGWTKESRFADSDGAREDSFMVTIFGEDHETVARVKSELEPILVAQSGVVGVANRGRDNKRRDELALSIERSMIERLGIPADAVASTVAYAVRGQPLPRLHSDEADQEIDVVMRYKKSDREHLDQVLQFKVGTKAGKNVPIQVVTDKHVRPGQTQLVRTDKRVADVIRLDLDPDDRETTVRRLESMLANYRLPDGVTFDADRERRDANDARVDLMYAGLLSICFIFLLMGFLFESFVLPLSVLPSIPLSFVGVWWFLYLTGSHIDPLAGIGVILLLGVVVNNAIVLVDFINNARAQGLSREDAVLQAGRQRLRPILMTALTTIGGMIPLAFSQPTGEGIPYGPFGKTLLGGMITATALTLLAVPVFYTYLDDLRELGRAWIEKLWR